MEPISIAVGILFFGGIATVFKRWRSRHPAKDTDGIVVKAARAVSGAVLPKVDAGRSELIEKAKEAAKEAVESIKDKTWNKDDEA